MDSTRASVNEGITFLSECVSDGMTPYEAADAMHDCWLEAEAALAPVLGRDGLRIVLRNGEEVAVRNVAGHSPATVQASIGAFCDWVKRLEPREALTACKSFLLSVEHYLVSLVGPASLRKLLRRRSSSP